MIIDSHVHFGKSLNFDMKQETVLAAMKKYKISKAIVSNSQACEVDHQQIILPQDLQVPMIKCTQDAVDFARNNPGKIFAAIWVKPLHEKVTPEFTNLIKENLDVIKAIKFHPYHSKIKFDGPEADMYLKLAADLNLPVITHTGTGDCDNVFLCLNVAKKYPSLKIIMAHLGLGSDNSDALDVMAQADNLYGDTTWVPVSTTVELIKRFGSERTMFGSDMPIDGLDTYHHNPKGEPSVYQDYFNKLPKIISKKDFDNVMYKNARNIFGI